MILRLLKISSCFQITQERAGLVLRITMSVNTEKSVEALLKNSRLLRGPDPKKRKMVEREFVITYTIIKNGKKVRLYPRNLEIGS